MKLSIITINYNNLAGLKLTMQSVFEQTTHEFEYIVIDGGSKDGSKEFIETNSSHLTYWVSEPDGGIFAAMNKGVQAAQGAYCLFLNSGDKLHAANVVEKVLPLLDGEDFYNGHTLFMHKKPIMRYAPTHLTANYLLTIPLCHQSTFIRTELLRNRPYNEELVISDWEQMVYEILICQRSYAPIDLVISDYDVTGYSAQDATLPRRKEEARKAVQSLFPPIIWEAILGNTPLERKILAAFNKPSALARDWKIIRNVLKVFPRDIFHCLQNKQ